MNKSERAIVIILRVVGFVGLFAIPAIFLPYSWMNTIHGHLGMGELPNAPIVDYLARSLSAFYAIVSVFTLFIARDIRRNRELLQLWTIMVIVIGLVLTGIDIAAGMPMSWTVLEGPPVVVVGVVVLWLQRRIVVK